MEFVLGMALSGLLAPRMDTSLAAMLVIPAIVMGGRGLPVHGGRIHIPPAASASACRDGLRWNGGVRRHARNNFAGCDSNAIRVFVPNLHHHRCCAIWSSPPAMKRRIGEPWLDNS
jgi:hypothetical protein